VGTAVIHVERVAPGLAPGALWVRLCSIAADPAGDLLILEGPLRSPRGIEAVAEAHGTAALAHAEATGEEVRLYVYDGDSGECLTTAIVPGRGRG
jgi:hypothetical protein